MPFSNDSDMMLLCIKEHPTPNPVRTGVEKLWPNLTVLLSTPLLQTSVVLL